MTWPRLFVQALASLKVTVLGLVLLLALTVWGTLYQADHGLYEAQERFYQSWVFRAGPVPLPGAQLVMVLLFVNLAASLLHMAMQRRLRLGFVATHAGLALMLAAGGVTFYFGRSAHLTLEEGQGANVALSDQDWELALMPGRDGERRWVQALDARRLHAGRRFELPGGELSLRVEAYHRNCTAERREEVAAPHNAEGYTQLRALAPAREPGQDRPGAILSVERGGTRVGRVLLWGGDRTPTPLPGAATPLVMGLRRLRLPLPATIELMDFKRELHPGTSMARSYASQVVVRSGTGSDRKVLISMNKPLRLQGFTFYQSSFANTPGGREVSTLAVVRNQGRLLPYLATSLTGLGMLLHFSGLLLVRARTRAAEGAP